MGTETADRLAELKASKAAMNRTRAAARRALDEMQSGTSALPWQSLWQSDFGRRPADKGQAIRRLEKLDRDLLENVNAADAEAKRLRGAKAD